MLGHHWFDGLAKAVAQRRSWRETLRRVRGHLRFLWVEEGAPPAAAGQESEEPPGVPMPLRRATMFGLAGALGVALMERVIGVRLVAPVDAAPGYFQACRDVCNDEHRRDLDACKGLHGPERADCNVRANQQHQQCVHACHEQRT